MGIVLSYCQYGVLYLGSYYNTGPYTNFPHFGNSNLGKLPNENYPLIQALGLRANQKPPALLSMRLCWLLFSGPCVEPSELHPDTPKP